jgi:hypothetical protein
MAEKLQEGDSISMQGEVSRIHEDGRVTVWLNGYGLPLTTPSKHICLVAKKRKGKSRAKEPDLL